MDAVARGEITTLVIAHRDRFVRFGSPWFEHFCAERGTDILVLNAQTLSPEAGMVQDLMTIVASMAYATIRSRCARH
jgi:putative resolvase